jgi:hypothetical protein
MVHVALVGWLAAPGGLAHLVLEQQRPGQDVRRKIRQNMPSFARVTDPVSVTFQG